MCYLQTLYVNPWHTYVFVMVCILYPYLLLVSVGTQKIISEGRSLKTSTKGFCKEAFIPMDMSYRIQ